MNEIDFSKLDLNLLKVFEALYEEGGAGRAALRLGLTQSAVSAALARLRTLYGDHLFVRTGRGLRPTASAEVLRPLISAALDKCRQSLMLSLAPDAGLTGRTLTLGLSDDYEMALGDLLIGWLAERAPGLRLILRQTNAHLVGEMLQARQIDLGLTAGGLVATTLGRQALGTGGYACLFARSQAPTQPLDLAEFLRRDHLLISSGGFVGQVDASLAERGLSRRVRASTTHFSALAFLLPDSDCIATLPAHAAQALARHGPFVCLPCPLPMPRYPVELGWRADSLRDPAIQYLKQLVVEAARLRLGLEG